MSLTQPCFLGDTIFSCGALDMSKTGRHINFFLARPLSAHSALKHIWISLKIHAPNSWGVRMRIVSHIEYLLSFVHAIRFDELTTTRTYMYSSTCCSRRRFWRLEGGLIRSSVHQLIGRRLISQSHSHRSLFAIASFLGVLQHEVRTDILVLSTWAGADPTGLLGMTGGQ